MNFEEKNIYAGFVSTLIIFTTYFIVVSGMYSEGRFEGAEGNALLGRAILSLMGGGIVVHMLVMIVMNILLAIAARDPKPSFVVDERDKMIELRGLQISYYVFGAGYVVAMVLLALGFAVFWVFNMMLAACALSVLVEGATRLAYYRRGI